MTELEQALAELDTITEFCDRGMKIYRHACAHLVEAKKVVDIAKASNDVLGAQLNEAMNKVQAATAASIAARQGYVS
jgi:exonuclease VII small subunit